MRYEKDDEEKKVKHLRWSSSSIIYFHRSLYFCRLLLLTQFLQIVTTDSINLRSLLFANFHCLHFQLVCYPPSQNVFKFRCRSPLTRPGCWRPPTALLSVASLQRVPQTGACSLKWSAWCSENFHRIVRSKVWRWCWVSGEALFI